MARKARRSRLGGSIARRWFAVGALVLVGLLYYRPLHDYFAARSQRAARVAAVRQLEKQAGDARAAAAARFVGRRPSRQQARTLGYIRPGDHLFIVKDIPQWRRRQHGGSRLLPRRGHWTLIERVVARQLGREPRTLPPASRSRCPFGAPAVTEQSPYSVRRRAVPDDVLPHVPASRRGRVAPRGRRRSRALERGHAQPSRRSPRASRPPTTSSARLRTRARRRHDRQRRRRVARLRHRRLAPRRQPQVPPRARRVRARPPRLRARRADPRARSSRAGPSGAAPSETHLSRIAVARQEWEEGSRRLEAARDDARRYRQLLELLDLILDELRKRIGQTYTLEELVAAYGESERWARELLEERSTLPGWPRDLTLVLAAAFDAYQRGAIDYEP